MRVFDKDGNQGGRPTPFILVSRESDAAVVQSLVYTKIKEIIEVCTERLEGDLEVVTARRDAAFRELATEREWVRILELTLRNNEIPLPRDLVGNL